MMTIHTRIQSAARELASLYGGTITRVEEWHGVPVEQLSEESQLELLAHLNNAIAVLRERRMAA